MLKNKKLSILLSAVLIGLLFGFPAWGVVDISNLPLDAQTKAAPANIMFVLDDSGSMDWEFMTEESSGLFNGEYYVFDNPGDNLYSSSNILDDTKRLMWQSQWSDYNKMYYNPGNTYEPWPTLPAADPDNPRSHPNISANTFNLSTLYLQVSSAPAIIVDNKDAGFSIISGNWYESGASPEYNNSSYYSGSAGATARWTLNVGTAGDYQVWMWWTSKSGWSRDSNARYRVSHAAGTTDYYRNLTVDYGKWNLLGSHTFNAGTTTVELLRGNSNTAADAVKLVDVNSTVIDIPRAHYYVYSKTGSKPYLVTIDAGSLQYYAVSTSGTGSTEKVEGLTLEAAPPADVVTGRSYAAERQNFANWYSFFRRRELTATAAVSNVIANMKGVQIGISSINDRINQVVKKIKVEGVDETSALLSSLYSLVLYANGTPLRRGLQDVGQYYHQNDGNTGGIGNSPYWSAALGGECQQSFAILMTDGYWNGSYPGVGNADGDNGVPFADSYSETLADVAMYYWENDLSSGLADLVPTSLVDPSSKQHMVTYGISFGVKGTLNPDDYNLTSPPYPTWPNPTSGNAQKIDDLYHASVDGHGVFVNAGNPNELVDALLAIMQNIEDRIGSASSVSVNGDELYKKIDDDTFMYQSSYASSDWTGDVRAFKVDPKTGAINMDTPLWRASEVWDGMDWGNRKIVTYNGTSGIPFKVPDLTTTAQLALLDADPLVASDILDYIRGDQSKESSLGGVYRDRTSLLGDIVHSSPVYHEGVLYTGSNDGMLHALTADGINAGKELFSYIPSQVIQNLSLLTDPAYAHRYYVDLTATVAGPLPIGATKKTILVGGLGAGGIGYYALDVTMDTYYTKDVVGTETTLADRVLWEFPNASTAAADLADIGYSFSEVLIVKTNDTSNPWVVLFGNGYNSTNGKSVLFALDPATGAVLKKFVLGAGPSNGLATPAVTDVQGDGKADYVYAGDLNGDLWKINLTGNLADWAVSFETGGLPAPLFHASGPGGSVQPITAKPDVMYHPQKHGYMALFGTGKFLGTSDFIDKSVQTVYGVWDYGDDEDKSEFIGEFDHDNNRLTNQPSRVSLLEQTQIDYRSYTAAGFTQWLRTLSDNSITWLTKADTDSPFPNPSADDANNAGWFFDLPNLGERVVSRMLIRDKRAIYISFTPKESPCSPGGYSILHEVNAETGGRILVPVFDINQSGGVDGQDVIEIDDPNGPGKIKVVPTGVQRDGRLQIPAILKLGDEEIKYMSSSSGTIEMVREKGVRLGVSTWQEF